jgi:hypothetical protein
VLLAQAACLLSHDDHHGRYSWFCQDVLLDYLHSPYYYTIKNLNYATTMA